MLKLIKGCNVMDRGGGLLLKSDKIIKFKQDDITLKEKTFTNNFDWTLNTLSKDLTFTEHYA